MDHSFNIAVAKRLGIAPAVILNNLYWWIEKNRANEKHFYDGNYWTYNSRKAFVTQFPYLTERQIEYALRKLVDEGYIVTGNYNKASFDRTLWYAITKEGYCILQFCEMENTKLLNGNNKNVEPIPDINTDNKHTDKSLPNGKEGKAPKQSYNDIFSNPQNSVIKDALVSFVNSCKGKNYNPKVATVEKFAKTLRDNAGSSEDLAMLIVKQSIDKGWKDLYPLKDKYKAEAVSKKYTGETAKDHSGKELVY